MKRLALLAALATVTLLTGCPDEGANPLGPFAPVPDAPAFTRLSELKNATYTDVAIASDGTVHAIFRDTSGNDAGDFNVYHRASSDGGATWSPAVELNAADRDRAVGFIRLAIDGAGKVYAFWKASEFSALGFDELPSGGLKGGSLVYRVLENGTWSETVTVGPEKHVYSWFPALDTKGQLHLVYNEDVGYDDGTFGGAPRSGSIKHVQVTGGTVSAPVEVTKSLSITKDYLGKEYDTYDGYEGLRGYIDAAGQVRFVAQKIPAVELGDVTDVVYWNGTAEKALFPVAHFTDDTRFYRDSPQLLVDAAGREHLLVLDEKAERATLLDVDPDAPETRKPVFQVAAAKDQLKAFQVAQGAGGRMAAFAVVKVGEQPEDLYVSRYENGQWAPAVNVTNNGLRSDAFSRTTATGDKLDAQFRWYAGYTAGAFDAAGALNLVFLNAQGTTWVDTSTVETSEGPVRGSVVGGDAWPFVFFTKL